MQSPAQLPRPGDFDGVFHLAVASTKKNYSPANVFCQLLALSIILKVHKHFSPTIIYSTIMSFRFPSQSKSCIPCWPKLVSHCSLQTNFPPLFNLPSSQVSHDGHRADGAVLLPAGRALLSGGELSRTHGSRPWAGGAAQRRAAPKYLLSLLRTQLGQETSCPTGVL